LSIEQGRPLVVAERLSSTAMISSLTFKRRGGGGIARYSVTMIRPESVEWSRRGD